jgi:nucleoside-diphosphate-sugar epimerase
MQRKVVLVTGAGGFIGRCAVPPLRARGYEVHAVLHLGSARPAPPELEGIKTHCADLFDESAVASLMRTVLPSHLLHFAWVATPKSYWTSPDNARWLAASQSLLAAFHGQGGRRAVMAGSSAEYDWSVGGVCHEFAGPLAAPAGPAATPYADCKIAMQRALADFGAAHHLSTAWGRIFFQFGPAEHPERLVASTILHLLAGREALCSHGRQIRSFLHVADVGSAFAAVLDGAVEGPVNIGSGEPVSLAAVVEEIGRQLGRPDLVRLGARSAPPSEPPVLVPDVSRLRTEVGWAPRHDLRGAIADTIAWWRRALAAGGGAAPPVR